MSRAFGLVECILALLWIALATWGIALTLWSQQSPAPSWLQPAAGVWT